MKINFVWPSQKEILQYALDEITCVLHFTDQDAERRRNSKAYKKIIADLQSKPAKLQRRCISHLDYLRDVWIGELSDAYAQHYAGRIGKHIETLLQIIGQTDPYYYHLIMRSEYLDDPEEADIIAGQVLAVLRWYQLEAGDIEALQPITEAACTEFLLQQMLVFSPPPTEQPAMQLSLF